MHSGSQAGRWAGGQRGHSQPDSETEKDQTERTVITERRCGGGGIAGRFTKGRTKLPSEEGKECDWKNDFVSASLLGRPFVQKPQKLAPF